MLGVERACWWCFSAKGVKMQTRVNFALPMAVRCDACGATYGADERLAGRTLLAPADRSGIPRDQIVAVKCRRCEAVLTFKGEHLPPTVLEAARWGMTWRIVGGGSLLIHGS